MKVFFLSAAILFSALIIGQPAECVYCPTFTCYARCGQCACMVPPGQVGGQCVSFQRAPEGWIELP